MTRDSKDCEFESRHERRESLLLQNKLCVLTLIRCLFHPCVTAVACRRPRSFCQKCRWQVTPKRAYTLDPTKLECADCAAVNELTRVSGNTRPQLSQLAEPLWTDLGLKSGIRVRKLISTLKKKSLKAWKMPSESCTLTSPQEQDQRDYCCGT